MRKHHEPKKGNKMNYITGKINNSTIIQNSRGNGCSGNKVKVGKGSISCIGSGNVVVTSSESNIVITNDNGNGEETCMPKIVIKNKVYDASKLNVVCSIPRFFGRIGRKLERGYGKDVWCNFECKVCRTEKGNWLMVSSFAGDIRYKVISEKEAKKLLKQYDYEAYVKLYGELEEA